MSDIVQNTNNNIEHIEGLKTEIDKIDISMLHYMYSYKKEDALYSIKIKELHNFILKKQNITYYTIVRRVKRLLSLNYILKGYKIGNADTYYLSEKGIKFLNEHVLNIDSAYKYIPEEESEEDKEEE
ncbi:hypothetical protein ACFHWD_03875 [Clostridium sp. MT-14]|uniref:hypothetical protein n=1 Tax=Clostridium sp. MT-14 TaxID=3348360 RepID=UPI0035F2DE69